jgi:hypothetical protein
MDVTTFAGLIEALSKGGPIVLFLAVWVAIRAGRTAEKAVQALTDIRDSVVKNGPLIEKISLSTTAAEEALVTIDERTRTLDLKLTAALSQRHATGAG